MREHRLVSVLFAVGGAYDAILGIVFLFFAGVVYAVTGIEPPNHMGYIQFPACLLIIFGVMFFSIAARPAENVNLIPYGVMLKASYCGVIGWYWLLADLPAIWKPFAVFDAVFLVLFLAAYASLRRSRSR